MGKLTRSQKVALENSRDFGNPFTVRIGPNKFRYRGARESAGGSYMRMVEKLANAGLINKGNWSITPAGRLAIGDDGQ